MLCLSESRWLDARCQLAKSVHPKIDETFDMPSHRCHAGQWWPMVRNRTQMPNERINHKINNWQHDVAILYNHILQQYIIWPYHINHIINHDHIIVNHVINQLKTIPNHIENHQTGNLWWCHPKLQLSSGAPQPRWAESRDSPRTIVRRISGLMIVWWTGNVSNSISYSNEPTGCFFDDDGCYSSNNF